MSDEYVIIVAGGTGSRMTSELPKQFMKICGKEIILHTIEKFQEYNSAVKIVIAVHADYLDFLHALLASHHCNNILVVKGGDTRFQSVKNALAVITDKTAIIAVHDAARPLVSAETIKRCYETAKEKGNAIPAIRLNESIREVNGEKNRAVNRDALRIIQTPQCFRADLLKSAFETEYDPRFTDDASVLEAAGHTIFLVQGNEENIKITLPKDLLIAEIFLKNEQ